MYCNTPNAKELVEFREGKAMVVEFNGIKFRRYPNASQRSDRVYYRPHAGHIRGGVGYLHQEVWKAHNGPIPEGYHVHHKDGNPLNNSINNLELMIESEHLSMHGKDGGEAGRWYLDKYRKKAAEWHRSPEGRRWHQEHARRTWKKRIPIPKNCDECGSAFESITRRDNDRFCSNACKSRWRRASGLDDETRHCVVCKAEFRVNKYSETQTCSRSCGAVLGNRKRKTT